LKEVVAELILENRLLNKKARSGLERTAHETPAVKKLEEDCQELRGEVGHINAVTDAVPEEVASWQARPWEAVCPLI